MKTYFVSIFIVLIFLGCDSQEPGSSATSKYLSISKASINSAPIAINQEIYLGFSSALQHSSISSESVYIVDDENRSIGVKLDYYDAEKKIVFTPYKYFESLSSYTLVITTALKDLENRSLSEEFRFTFTTLGDDKDASPLQVRSLKPKDNTSDVLVSTDIAIDFTKNLSLEAQFDTSDYLMISVDGKSIEGKIEVFNSILKFIPTNALPYDANISVVLTTKISDMYGNQAPNISYSFKTKEESSTDNNIVKFKALNSMNTNKTVSIVRNIYNDENSSKIVVGTSSGLDIYKINYSKLPSIPSFEYLSSFAMNSKIHTLLHVDSKYLIVGTSDGIYSFGISSDSSLTQVGKYVSGENIYAVTLGAQSNENVLQVYGVGPTFGVQKFDMNINTGVLTPTIKKELPSKIPLDIDTVKYTQDDKLLQRVYVADYKGGVSIYDENMTDINTTDLNGSIKRLLVGENYGEPNGVYALSSLGYLQQLSLDGELNQYSSLGFPGEVSDFVYANVNEYSKYMYLSSFKKGVMVVGENYLSNTIDTNGSVVSSDVIRGFSSKIPFLVTLNLDGKLQIFNAINAYGFPYLNTNPSHEGTMSSDSNFTISTYDSYIDTTTITKESFTFKNTTLNESVDFNLLSSYENGSSSLIYSLVPTQELQLEHKYNVTIDGDISDMMGNKFNGGIDKNISFSVE